VQRLNGVTTIVAKRNNAALRKNEQAFWIHPSAKTTAVTSSFS
jgi:hypothetical protein